MKKEIKSLHDLSNKTHDESANNIKTAFFLNILFAVLECIGGFLTNSVAIISDAVHDLGDSVSIGVSYILERKSKKIPDANYTYGYLRYSLLGAFITAFVLLIGSVFVISNAIPKIVNPGIINYDGMIIFAIFGVLINGYAAYVTSKGEKTNEKAINLHMLEDVLGWIVVLIGSIIMRIWDLPIIDPILSIMVAIYILVHVYKYLKEVFNIFMERVPTSINVARIEEELKKNDSLILDIHHTHIWTMDGVNNYMTTHLVVSDKITSKNVIKIKHEAKEKLEELNINHSTIEIEYSNEKCTIKKCNIEPKTKVHNHAH